MKLQMSELLDKTEKGTTKTVLESIVMALAQGKDFSVMLWESKKTITSASVFPRITA